MEAENVTKVCGACSRFTDEDVEGNGWCEFHKEPRRCSEYCTDQIPNRPMDLTTFAFPSVNAIEMVFSDFDTIPELLAEAKRRGFYEARTPYNRLFSTLFFHGGRVVWKKGIDERFRAKAWPYCRALMRSFAPRHEDKEAVCAMLLSELAEPEPAK